MNRELRVLIVLLLDAYKLFHRQMYPKNTILVYSNATARGGKHRGKHNQGYVISFGMQRLVRKMKDKFQDFFDMEWSVIEPFLVEQLGTFTGRDYCINHLKELHNLGYVPMVIKALPEGSKVPYGIPYMTMYNTLPKFYWLTNYLETWMSSEEWDLVTSATTAHQFRQVFDKWAMKTVGNTDFVAIQGHDFSMRGQKGSEAASMSTLGHLTSFVGIDTVPGYLDAQYYYDSGLNRWGDLEKKGWMDAIVGTSIPATEHSVQCAHFSEFDGNELAYLDHILETFPTGPVSVVCDGMDFWGFLTETVPQRKAEIMARDGKIVFRPDSGNPADIICGNIRISKIPKFITNEMEIKALRNTYNVNRIYHNCNGYFKIEVLGSEGLDYLKYKFWKVDITSDKKGAVEVLWDLFGGTKTEKGYKLLDEHIGLIYGDSITIDSAEDICSRLEAKGFASINWVAGIGSYTYQMVTRDTDGQAFKATYIEKGDLLADEGVKGLTYNNIIGKEIFKDPKTGDGSKKSAKGLLSVGIGGKMIPGGGRYILQDQCSWEEEKIGSLQEIFRDGKFDNVTTLQEIRRRLHE